MLRPNWIRIILILLFPIQAFGLAEVGIDSSGFLRKSADRASSASTLFLGPQFGTQGRSLGGMMDLKALMYAEDSSLYTAEAKNAYLSTGTDFFHLHQFTLGRRVYEFSRMDDFWQMGMWQPRFLWDPIQPEIVGLTGLFYTFGSRYWRIIAYGSGVAIPERGAPVESSQGQISGGPWFRPLPEAARIEGAQVPIRYSIEYPSTSEMIFRPSFLSGIRFGDTVGFWGGITYGLMPVHQPEISMDIFAKPDGVEVDLFPQFTHHHLLTTEMGYRGAFWSFWGSLTGEKPLQTERRGSVFKETGDAIVASWGGSLFWNEGFELFASYISVWEQGGQISGDRAQDIDFDLPSRFIYRKAWKVGGQWKGLSPITYGLAWIFDVTNKSNLISMDLGFNPEWVGFSNFYKGFRVGLGADLISTGTGKGNIGQFEGNDRIRAKISYLF